MVLPLTGEPLYAENLHMAIKKQDLNELEAVLKSGYVSSASKPFACKLLKNYSHPVECTCCHSYKYHLVLDRPTSKEGRELEISIATVCFT